MTSPICFHSFLIVIQEKDFDMPKKIIVEYNFSFVLTKHPLMERSHNNVKYSSFDKSSFNNIWQPDSQTDT